MSYTWKTANVVFEFPPRLQAQIRGCRVRNQRPLLLVPLADPVEGEETALSVVAGKVGFVHGLRDGDVLIALPRNPAAQPADLEALLRTNCYDVIRVSWRTFHSQFEVGR